MDFNFFNWIREGVRRSVLLGVSDAVEQIGAPPEEEAVKGNMLGFFQDKTPSSQTRKRVTSSPSTGGRKKLGRSIKDIAAADAS